MCCGVLLKKLKYNRHWYTMDKHSWKYIANLEKVVSANLNNRPFTNKEGENPLLSQVRSTRANSEVA